MDLPVLVAVDDDAEALAAVERELLDRYARHYRVVGLGSAGEAAELLDDLARNGTDVALVLSAQWLPGTTGSELLDRVRRSHPHARRALLIDWGQWGQNPTGDAIFDGIAHGWFDHYVVRPTDAPDEYFHESISSMLLDWAEDRRAAPYTVHVVGESWSGRAYELREALQPCALPHHFCLADSADGKALVAAAGDGVELPIMVFPGGDVLVNPTNTEIAVAAGAPVSAETAEFDVVIVGAGPAGLSAAVYGASEGLSTLVVDRGGIGGQATSSSLIRNYLGFPRGITGRQLARQAYDQAWMFGARFAFMLERHRHRTRRTTGSSSPSPTGCRSAPPWCCSPWVPATAPWVSRRWRRSSAPGCSTAAPPRRRPLSRAATLSSSAGPTRPGRPCSTSPATRAGSPSSSAGARCAPACRSTW